MVTIATHISIQSKTLAMTALNKITAVKLLILINLPILLLAAGVYQLGSAVMI